MTPVRLEPAALRSRVKHSTTEPLRSLNVHADVTSKAVGLNFGLSIHLQTYLCIQPAKVLTCLCICADTPEPSLLSGAISIEISCNGQNSLLEKCEARPRGYKTLFMLNSAEYKISTAHKN